MSHHEETKMSRTKCIAKPLPFGVFGRLKTLFPKKCSQNHVSSRSVVVFVGQKMSHHEETKMSRTKCSAKPLSNLPHAEPVG